MEDDGPPSPQTVDSGGEDEASDSRSESEAADTDGGDAVDEFDVSGSRGTQLSRAQLAELEPQEQLAKWHGTLLPLEVDLVKELDGTNLFFIHAESIIFDLIQSEEVPFEEDTQFLRLTYTIEQLLNSIRACEGVFRLIFFDDSKVVFGAAFGEAVWAFRQAFLLHCQTAGIDHFVLPSWYSPQWKEHVAQWRPSFFLVSNAPVEIEDEEEDDEEDEEQESNNPKLRGFFHALMLKCLSFKIHVAVLRGLARRGNRIMAFTVESDMYNSFIDQNVQAMLEKVFEESREDEEEEEDDEENIVEVIQEFASKAGDKVGKDALLRSFCSVRFAKQIVEKSSAKGTRAEAADMMQVVAKVLLVQEMLLRHVPLEKRAYKMFSSSEWELFDEHISSALENYFSTLSADMGALSKAKLPEELALSVHDLFDGRLYRHTFFKTIQRGLEKKGKVDAAFFGLQGWADEELSFLWKQTGAKDKFFPITMSALLNFPGIEPPALPDASTNTSRKKPQLAKVDSELLHMILQAASVKDIAEKEVPPVNSDLSLFSDFKWANSGLLDAVVAEETMEMNEGEKRMAEKMKGKKLTARDIEFQRKFQLKKRQLALRALHQYSKSLTGSDKLHPPIIMKDDKDEGKGDDKKADDKKAKKAEPEVKKSKAQLELEEKLNAEKAKKIREHDESLMDDWEKRIKEIGKNTELEKLEKEMKDMVLGHIQVTDSFVNLPGLSGSFKTSEAQCKVAIKLVKAVKGAVNKMKLDKMDGAGQLKARHFVRYYFCLVQEVFNMYSKKEMDGKGIKLLQEVLLSIGFPKTSERMFNSWLADQKAKAEAEAAAAAAAAGAKGGKDDKKKGKEEKKDDKKNDKKDDKKKDKKDDKKKDKKDGKDDKDDDEEKDPDSYRVTKSVELDWSGVGPDEFAWQLSYLGHYMARSVGNAKDPKARVNFRPDKWQRDLLDIVDDDKSALIVAPTASGKTFIGYYVMDKVLRSDNEGVAVYVAPSKALVNQVSAEIYARFSSKTYPPHSKNELLGVFLREYNSAGGVMEAGKWKNCQVLVTIPHILEMLLMSPSNQEWVKRLRWVVFDEVHCIGEQEGGAQWEHVMQAIPCPFIALSATVSDPSFFHSWLRKVSCRKDQSEVEFVQHTERWNDLYKYMFVDGNCRPLHPFCCLLEQSVRQNGLSQDLTLTPQEMVQLWTEVDAIIGKNELWSPLVPVDFFGPFAGFLSKHDVRTYERSLKKAFLQLLNDGVLSGEDFSRLVAALQVPRPIGGGGLQFKPPPRGAVADGATNGEKGPTDMTKVSQGSSYLGASTLLRVCRDLDQAQNLPAIIFNFSRKEIDRMINKLSQELKDQQWHKYYGTEEAAYKSKKIMEKRQADYKKRMETFEQAQKAKSSKKQEGTAARKQADEGEGRSVAKTEAVSSMEDELMEEPEKPIDIAEEIDMEFTFHSPKALGQWSQDINDMLKALRDKGVAKSLIDAMRRGIGMHHEGCRKNYRDAVEILFRRGYLRVVFATGTLALGINMPCRATVFCGESLELNGLMYRQMSGRAGRRGFDLQGQVVFLDMAFAKVRRLVASDLSSLTGEFVQSPTTLLRALHEWELVCMDEAADKPLARTKGDIARCLVPMFSMPFFRSDQVELDTQVAYFTRYSAEFLYREGLIGPSGFTRNLANLVTHLFEIEPANFALSRLLANGALHEYLTDAESNERKGERRTHLTVKLTAILAWLLYPRRLPSSAPTDGPQRKKHLPSKACPYLPPLPLGILKEIQEYNKHVFETFQQFGWSVASTWNFGEHDLSLPYTKKRFPAAGDCAAIFKDDSEFCKDFLALRSKFRSRSPFSALSGVADFYSSPTDLVKNIRPVVHLDLNSLPMIAPPLLGGDGLEPTNSWMLDFMIHGKIKYLWEDNGLSSTKAWKLISSFKDAVKMATTALKVYSPPDDIVLRTFTNLAGEMEAYLKAEGGK